MYPSLDIHSLKERFDADIELFIKTYEEADDTGLSLVFDESKMNSVKNLHLIIDPAIEYIDKHLHGKNYVDEISHQSTKSQAQLWIARTYIFYQLLIFLTTIVKNRSLYNKVFFDKSSFSFRQDIVAELHNFKLGIFGSITPTSDIDVGIQYSGNTLLVPGLSYIVSRFENLFVLFSKKTIGSLAYDIETYADMMTIPNPYTGSKKHPDYFYLDSSKFTEDNFKTMLECAGKSVARNAILSHKYANKHVNLNDLTFGSIMKKINLSNTNSFLTDDILELLREPEWFNRSKKEVSIFLNMSYIDQRYAYYTKVMTAETMKFKTLRMGLTTLLSDDICLMMVLIGDALTYRMESYICAPTVIHVVRILQASQTKLDKYKTLLPKHYCNGKIQHIDPFCSIGKYGYLLSILEQIGYIYRTNIQYCSGKRADKKCIKKMKKYKGRYYNALLYFEKYKTPPHKINHKTKNSFKRDRRTKTHKRRRVTR